MQSIIQERGPAVFPEFTGERVYMREFRKAAGLPRDLRRWQPTVDAMLDGVDADGPIYIMIDQGVVSPGAAHRRPGLHIDGYWMPELQAHRGGGGRHVMAGAGWDTGPRWVTDGSATHWPDEALILASDVQACRAFAGTWEGAPGDGGDCAHINTAGMRELLLKPGTVYAANVTGLHESLPLPQGGRRTLVRLNVPGWSPKH